MSNSVTREHIIEALRSGLQRMPSVYAAWLEGADALDAVDDLSDIDVVVDAEDGSEDLVLERVSWFVSELGPLDYKSTVSVPSPGLRHQVFHVSRTPETLLIDAVVQSHSREFVFTRGHPSERPKVLFDKADVVRFRELGAEELSTFVRRRIENVVNDFRPRGRVLRYVDRDLFLEALAAYWKYVLAPLVEVLRLKYSPLTHDYGLVHISKHLPADVVQELERLYAVARLADIRSGISNADEWFSRVAAELMDSRSAGAPAPSQSA